MEDIKTLIETVKVSNIRDLSRNVPYEVKPYGSENCIYKKCGVDPKTCVITFRLGEGNFYDRLLGIKALGSATHRNRINTSYFTPVHLEMDAEVRVSTRKGKSDWQKEMMLGENFYIADDIREKRVLSLEGTDIGTVVLGGRHPELEHYKRYNTLNRIAHSGIDITEENVEACLKAIESLPVTDLKHTSGITKVFSQLSGEAGKLSHTHATVLRILAHNTKSTISGVKFSTIFNRIFSEVNDLETLKRTLSATVPLFLTNLTNERRFCEKVMESVPEARELKKAALKRKSTGSFNKIMDDLDFVKIDENLYPLTHQAVHSGDLPLGTFFRKNGESYFVYNDNWELWEEMLRDHREVAIEIANSAAPRTTYEKDLMSYFYFTLRALPEYLKRHTHGKEWKGIPKLVNSSNELDPPKEGENGVSKTRSALTPIVDNENGTVTVPYVSMKIGGYQTTYCYGLNYQVLEKGLSFNGNVVMKDIEKELNGRDDYGLMFYTLTGTAQGRGYPTFLIIFERLIGSTRVHFHRTHPMRSKGGDYNPIHNWTVGCYKWMIGNVSFERILAQQGDLAFVSIDDLPEGEVTQVTSYDSHRFEKPVDFVPYTKKERNNILGYVRLSEETALDHTEHLRRLIPAGTYEIRQCRSWEANPKGIWSLRID